jgi:diguanylate cyclase (GGDEF)-like protein
VGTSTCLGEGGGVSDDGKLGAVSTHRPAQRTRWWALPALLCVVGGIVASVLGARAIARADASSSERAAQRGSAAIVSSVRLETSRQQDLTLGASTFLAGDPKTTAGEFHRWVHWARALRRNPQLYGLGLIALSGTRAARCVVTMELTRGATPGARAAVDRCATTPGLLASRDTGRSVYSSTSIARAPALEIDAPVYRGNVLPHSRAGRRAAFVGWLRTTLTPDVMLRAALQGHPSYAIGLVRRTGSHVIEFSSGSASRGAQGSLASVGGGWSAVVLAPPRPSASVFRDGAALALLIVGLLASIALGALVFVLGSAGRRPRTTGAQGQAQDDLYDGLTGLPNRALLLDRAERMLARAGRLSESLVGALFIDIDWFKDINDKLGAAAGDQLLQIVAARLEGVVRTHDTVARLEGDKFVVLVESAAQGMRLDSLARRVMEVLHEPIELGGFGPSFALTVSIGVAFGRYGTPEELLHDARQAMRAAEAAGRDRYTVFNANMRSVIEGRGVLEVELQAALAEDQLLLVYQPIFDLATREVVGLEALLRWMHPHRGLLATEAFLPLAEETGLIVPLGRWALQEACCRAVEWHVDGHEVGVSMKVSAKQLNRDGFTTDVRRALQQSGLDPSLLTLNVAEAVAMRDLAAVVARLEQLKALGVRTALDDLGTEYVHHAELQRMPLDALRVDTRPPAGVDDDYRNWLLEGIVVAAQDLSLPLIATGVDSHEQLATAQTLGCAKAQGLFLATPGPLETIEDLFGAEFPTVDAAHRAGSDPPGEA